MTQPAFSVESRASIDVRAAILPRAKWAIGRSLDGRPSFVPQKGTWYGHVIRGRSAHDVVIVPMVGCPSCGGLLFLSHKPETAKALGRMLGIAQAIPVAHSIDHLGKVSPDLLCKHGRCDFHRTVYLDQWNKTKKLFALAYTRVGRTKIEIAYSHAVDTKEARFHLGPGKFSIIAGGPAVGFYVDERTGRMTAD